MKNYDAKDAWLVIDGKRIFGFGDVDFHLAKDNSKENQDRLRDNFKYAQSEPIPAKRTIEFYKQELYFDAYKQIDHTEKKVQDDYSSTLGKLLAKIP